MERNREHFAHQLLCCAHIYTKTHELFRFGRGSSAPIGPAASLRAVLPSFVCPLALRQVRCVFAPCVRLEGIGKTTEAIGVAKMGTFSRTAGIPIRYVHTPWQPLDATSDAGNRSQLSDEIALAYIWGIIK